MSPDEDTELRAFTRGILDDLHALEQMLDAGAFDTTRRIGAELEMFLVDHAMRPAPIAGEVLAHAGDARLTHELARFNLEANATPLPFGGGALRALHAELDELVARASASAEACQSHVLLTGILPTLGRANLTLDNMTDKERYRKLNERIGALRGGRFDVYIRGIDELTIQHDNTLLESCNTSFQLHLQVDPARFAALYNLAQLISAPVLAAAVNSPVLLGQRLWHETRLALFQGAVDERSPAQHERLAPPRVCFGDAWINDSVLEIFREQLSRFRPFLPVETVERSTDLVKAGGVPRLGALCAYNGTNWRWNRACYGISEGAPHLRIENRMLPAGPSVPDMIANAALFYGLMSAGVEAFGDVRDRLDFDLARSNFFAAARHGLGASIRWLDGKHHLAGELLTGELLPVARAGLESAGVDAADIDEYLGIVEERVDSGMTGAQWILDSAEVMRGRGTRDQRLRSLAAGMMQRMSAPVHTWSLCEFLEDDTWRRRAFQTVGQIMSTDLFTVRPGDLVDLVANVMEWKYVRHVPVEDDDGRLVGIVTHRALLHMVARGMSDQPVPVREIMRPSPRTVGPDTPTITAMRLMREEKIGCLPVVDQGRLVGIVTERDLIEVSVTLLERFLSENEP